MTILITADGEFITEKGKTPKVGKRYLLEDATSGTSAQNKAFHALIGEYWKSGAHSYNADSFEHFRELIKLNLGAGAEFFVYATPYGLKKAKTIEEVPEEYRNEEYCWTKVISWTDYTLKERRETMDRLISEMHQVGVQSKKFYEILDGMA
jgi:hypothetical protein